MNIIGPNYNTTPQFKQTIEALWRLEKIVLDTLDFKDVIQKIVDSVLTELGYLKLGYRIIVLALVDKETQELKRVSISQTEEAKRALEVTPVPFEEIVIPLSAKANFCIRAMIEKKPLVTNDWKEILCPPYGTPEAARQVQGIVGIKTSMVYPVTYRNEVQGIIIFSMVKDEAEVSEEEKDLIRGFTDVVGLAVQNSKLYSALEITSDQLKVVNERLIELDKKKDEFVSIASHELRTPMTAIRSYLWLALAGKGGTITDKQKYYLERSYDSTVRLIKLVNDMLNVSRIESGRITLEMQKMDMGSFVNEVIAEVKPRADELGITIENHYDPASLLPAVIADPNKIKEVLINLIGNSLKFTPREGKVTLWFEAQGGVVTIHVSDTGAGIDPEDIPKLFQKFGLIGGSYVTNQKAPQGTGLGLYISRSIVELHGGKIWATSEGRGKGATFSLSLKVFSQDDLEKAKTLQEGKEGVGLVPNVI